MGMAELRERAGSKWQRLIGGGKPVITIGTATCGRAAGAMTVLAAFERELKQQNVEASLVPVGCMGMCYAEPLVIISKPGGFRVCYHNITEMQVARLVQAYLVNDDPCLDLALGTVEGGSGEPLRIPELPRFERELRLILRNCGEINPEDIDHYIAVGGYSALEKALAVPPEHVLNEVTLSHLRGRGGAGFPAGTKWWQARRVPVTPKYVICNGDEGDPGAFMDRVVLESDPHQVIEGMIICGYAIGSSQGYIYVRAEYPLAVRRLEIALRQAEEAGLLGDRILGSRFSFRIRIAKGAGAFVSGESTALMRAIEGERSMPRARPPHSAESGLWGKPTVLNNVKTFACVPLIIEKGAPWFASIGTEGSKGTAVFALAGKVVNSGLAEVPMGTTIRTLVNDIGGGVAGGRKLKAVQIGGPSGGCLPESLFDTPVDFDSLTRAGAVMGSGGLIVMDDSNCMVDTARFFLDFCQKESCGKCTLCRLGTRQLLDILNDIVAGRGRMEDLNLLAELGEDVVAGSLCGLGQTAPNPLLTTLRYFREEYEAHIKERRCPSLVCRDLIAYYIRPDRCDRACEHCVLTCPTRAIFSDEKGIKVIDQEKCTKCGNCLERCPPEFTAVIKISPVSALPPSPPRPKEA